jgi:DNA-binding beta-propeller fold protein YncE
MADFVMPGNTPAAAPADENIPHSDIARIGSVAVEHGPIGDIAAGDNSVVVTNYGDDSVAFLNADTLSVYGLVPLEGEPSAVVVADDRVYVSTTSSECDAVSVIDANTGTVIKDYSLTFSITALAVSPDGKRVYAGRTGDGSADVAVIDITAERVGTIDIAARPGIGVDALEVDPTGKRLYVATTDARGSALVVVDLETARAVHTMWIGTPIRDIAFGDGTAYVLTSDRLLGGVIHVVNLFTMRVADRIELGIGAPIQMVLSPDKTRVYVVDYDGITVACTLTHQIVDTVSIGVRPAGVAVDRDGGRLYVADYTGRVTSFTVETSMPLLYPHFMATDPIAMPEVRELQRATA